MQYPRSLFGPLLLIAIGAVWLLVKSGTIPAANLWALTHIWPFLLIAAGLGIGGEYGEGALRVNNTTEDYYNLASVSFGLQIGAQSKQRFSLLRSQA